MSKARALLLYKRDASPPSNAVRMLGQILGLQFQYKEPKIFAFEHKSPEFKKMNPMGTIPVLKDGDFVVSESHAIMKYLLLTYGQDHRERLYPSDVRTQALVDQAMYFDAGVVFTRLRAVAHTTVMYGLQAPTEQHVADITDAYGTLEGYLERNKYVAADHLTLADLSLGSTVTAIQVMHELDADGFPRSADWVARLEEESFFKDINAPGAAGFAQLMQFLWQNNGKVL